jgi:hypothetical protein
MIPRDNTLDMQHALAGAQAIRQAARGFAHVTRATKHILVDSRAHRAWFLGALPVIALSAVPGPHSQVIANSSESNSSVENEAAVPDKTRRHHDSFRPFQSDTASSRFNTRLSIFSSVLHSVAASPSRNYDARHRKSIRPGEQPDPLADLKQNANRLARELIAPFAPLLNRALVRAHKAINEFRTFLSNTSIISQTTKWTLLGIAALIAVGRVATYLTDKLIEALIKGWRVVLSPVSALRRLLVRGAPATLLWLSRLASEVAQYAVIFGERSLGWYLVIAAGLAVAGYELYRHWDAVKLPLSRWTESAHKAIARLMKWVADTTRSAAVYASYLIASLTATRPGAPRLSTTMAASARGMKSTLAVEHAGAVAQPAPMLFAVKRAAAAAAFAAPLMLAGAPAGAFAPPPISTNDTARLAAPAYATNATQGAIVINYAPNVVIHSEDAADSAALKRRVMEILERHGRELHQVLQREMVRQERRDFQPRYSNAQE